MNWSWSLEEKWRLAITIITASPVLDNPCKKIFLASNSSFTSDSQIKPFGTTASLHFRHCTNIFAPFEGSIDLAIKNLIIVASQYSCRNTHRVRNPSANRTKKRIDQDFDFLLLVCWCLISRRLSSSGLAHWRENPPSRNPWR